MIKNFQIISSKLKIDLYMNERTYPHVQQQNDTYEAIQTLKTNIENKHYNRSARV